MDRTERTGLGVAVAGHILVFGALSLGLMTAQKPPIVTTPPVDIQIVDEVAERDQAPDASQVEPAPSVAPEVGPPVADTPTPPVAESKPQASAPRPTPAPTTPKTAPAKPAPAKPVPAKPSPVKAAPPKATATRPTPPRGSRLGSDFLKGIADRPTASTSESPRAAIGATELSGLANAIRRQVQPCADRIASPGPGAEKIVTKLNLKMNRDGSFAAAPQIVSQVTDPETARYAARVGELARSAFVQCAPFELPGNLYEGGWKNINLNYKLPE